MKNSIYFIIIALITTFAVILLSSLDIYVIDVWFWVIMLPLTAGGLFIIDLISKRFKK